MSAATVQTSGQYGPVTMTAYPNPTSSPAQYLQQPVDNNDAYRANHEIYAASSQQSRDQRRAHASPSSTTRYNIGGTNDYTAATAPPASTATTVLPIHNRPGGTEAQYDPNLIIPPRTTSQASPVLSASSSRHVAPQPAAMPDYQNQRLRDEPLVGDARDRRRNPASPRSQSAGREQEQQYAATGRSEAASRANGLPPMVREPSEVINRVIVSDPTVDEERMRARIAEAQPLQPSADAQRMGLTSEGGGQEDTRGPQRRQDYSKSKRREIQFGEYILGQTLGEGEFGKVKLGWKKDGSSQVAIKLIRRESVAINPTRLPKIYREISILRDLAHPNIVRLHEMVETERHIGIILEYASGGELFDYILNQRYLKDPSARRLFAQLVSGVGYLHKKGIVHRDLKLENLLLDQNKNIIITDFGFANTFNSRDELSSEVEYNLANKDFVKKYKLDRVDANGMRKGDLMQTSCGSPCYAAPELVVSDSLYTGRKVDVWSCGVILYAMLAGYLPFDDDPANPEGDNINLLYKYITSTPLTFPDYVTPHSRDLLRRILVPDPRKRADLFEIARHSWLTEYHHVVAHVTSSTTNIAEISNSTVTTADDEVSVMNRSASVRVPPTITQRVQTQAGPNDRGEDPRRHMARHTLQAEYVAPQQHTERIAQQETVVQQSMEGSMIPAAVQKPLPQAPALSEQTQMTASQSQPIPAIQSVSTQDIPRSSSDGAGILLAAAQPSANQFATRPLTQGSATSFSAQNRPEYKLPSRGSYGMTAPPTVTTTTATGKVTAPSKNGSGYNISAPQYQQGASNSIGQSMAPPVAPASAQQQAQKGHHRRSSTLSSIGEKLFGRSNSVARKNRDEDRQKNGRRYPPTAMRMPMSSEPPQPRMSTDSKRSFTFLRRKESSEATGQEPQIKEKGSRRFSALLPNSMSLKSMLGGNRGDNEGSRTQSPITVANNSSYVTDGQQDKRNQNFSRPQASGHRAQQSTSDVYGGTGVYQAGSQQQFQHGRENSQNQFAQYADQEGSHSRPSMQQGRNTLTKPRRFNDGYDDHRGGTGAVKRVQDFFRRRGRARADSEYR